MGGNCNRSTNGKVPKQLARRRMLAVVAGLILCALAAASARLALKDPNGLPAGDRAWSVTLTTTVRADQAGGLVRLAPPWDTAHARLYGQSFSHPGMRQNRLKNNKVSRELYFVTTAEGSATLNARFDLLITQVPRSDSATAPARESDRSAWLAATEQVPTNHPEVIAIIERLSQDQPESAELVKRLFDYVSEHVRIQPNGSSSGLQVLQTRKGSVLGAHRALIALLRAAHLPARVVTGLDIALPAGDQPRHWAEAYYQERWRPLDIANGYLDMLPASRIPLRRGGTLVIESEHATLLNERWSIVPARAPQGIAGLEGESSYAVLDLTRLHPESRSPLALLLLLPLGVLATELMRHLVGMRTYGTFTPTLLALAAVYTEWGTAALVFGLVTTIGVLGRALMPELNLSRIPRLSAVFTLIALSMAFVVSGLIYIDPSVDSSVVLLPIVILTTLVDRIYSVTDELGPRTALLRLGWTLAGALVSLQILLQRQWGEFLLAYPELHLITIALVLALGRYSGPKLSDLGWLAVLREPPRNTTGPQRDDRSSDEI